MKRRPPSIRRFLAVTAPLLTGCLLLLGGCGGSNLEADPDEPIDRDKGRQLFQTSCRACHALSDADAAGVFGPDLDTLQPDAERVREQIDEGGGGMPADILEGEEADLVALYVAEVAGQGPDADEQPANRGATRGRGG